MGHKRNAAIKVKEEASRSKRKRLQEGLPPSEPSAERVGQDGRAGIAQAGRAVGALEGGAGVAQEGRAEEEAGVAQEGRAEEEAGVAQEGRAEEEAGVAQEGEKDPEYGEEVVVGSAYYIRKMNEFRLHCIDQNNAKLDKEKFEDIKSKRLLIEEYRRVEEEMKKLPKTHDVEEEETRRIDAVERSLQHKESLAQYHIREWIREGNYMSHPTEPMFNASQYQ